MTERQKKKPRETVAERVLPHDLDAERAVLGAVLVNTKAFDLASAVVTEAHFYRHEHRIIWTAYHTLDERRIPIDILTLKNLLISGGDLEECGGPAYIAALVDGVPQSVNVAHYAGLVREKASLREVITAANEMLRAAYAASEPAALIVAAADRAILDIQQGHKRSALQSLATLSPGFFRDVERRTEAKGQLLGVTSGIGPIDEMTFGWQPGDMIVTGAHSSMGKSTWTLNCAVAAARTGVRVAFFSLEMSKEQLQYKIASHLCQIPTSRLMGGFLAGPEMATVSQAFEEMYRLPIALNDDSDLTVQDMRHACRRMQAEGGLGMVVVDYIQMVPGNLGRKSATRYDELSDISRRLKAMARELHVPVHVLSQLNRSDGRPRLGSLRDSGRIEEDAAVVAFLHRKSHKDGGYTQFLLEKQRMGPTGALWLHMDRETGSFTDGGDGPAKTPSEKHTEETKESAPQRRRYRKSVERESASGAE